MLLWLILCIFATEMCPMYNQRLRYVWQILFCSSEIHIVDFTFMYKSDQIFLNLYIWLEQYCRWDCTIIHIQHIERFHIWMRRISLLNMYRLVRPLLDIQYVHTCAMYFLNDKVIKECTDAKLSWSWSYQIACPAYCRLQKTYPSDELLLHQIQQCGRNSMEPPPSNDPPELLWFRLVVSTILCSYSDSLMRSGKHKRYQMDVLFCKLPYIVHVIVIGYYGSVHWLPILFQHVFMIYQDWLSGWRNRVSSQKI